MAFNWVINLFKKQEDNKSSLKTIKIKQEDNTEKDIITVPKVKKPKEIYMENKDLNNMWLVVIDTTGLDKSTRDYNENNPDGDAKIIDCRKLGPLGIKTFAFVNAPDIHAAKGLLWRTLGAKNPKIRGFLAEIARATRATNFTQIFPLLTRSGVVWNYVGGNSEYLPGQQSALARQKELSGNDAYGNATAREYQPAPPVIPDGVETNITKSDVSNLSAEDRRVMQSSTPQMPQMPQMPNGQQMTPQQMMQMMQTMMQMMGANMNPQQAPMKVPETQSLTDLDPNDIAQIQSNKTQLSPEEKDVELEKQINEMRTISKENKSGISVDEDEQLDQAELERMAKMTASINPRNRDEDQPSPSSKRKRIAQ